MGLGHLQRCVALAQALRVHGHEASFAIAGGKPPSDVFGLSQFATYVGGAFQLGSPEDALWVRSLSDQVAPSMVVVDSYAVGEGYLEAVSMRGVKVAYIDDLNAFRFPCDVVIAPNVHAKVDAYEGASQTSFFVGARFVMLREEFWNPSRPKPGGPCASVLLTVGGGDPHGLMPGLIETADSVKERFSLRIVIGPYFRNTSSIHEVVQRATREIGIVDAPSSLRPILDETDLAICAGGQTLYEMMATRVPALCIEIAPNQRDSMSAVVRAGAAEGVGSAEDVDLMSKLGHGLVRLLASQDQRMRMAEAGHNLIDGKGALRVAQGLVELL